MQYAVRIKQDVKAENGFNTMKKNDFNFWKDHSDHYLKMAFDYERNERIKNPDGYGTRTGDCGDMIEIFLTMNNDHIQRVSFDTDGCRNTIACCNTIAHLSEGKNSEVAWEITPEDVIDFLETLPSENHHCAELAVGAFYLALTNCLER